MLAFAPHGVDGDVVPPTIEEMAAERLPAIIAAQPSGAFKIAGYCNGALLAYEVARQLLAAGRDIDIVVLIEPPSLNLRPAFRRLVRAAGFGLSFDGARTGAAGRRIGTVMRPIWVLRRGLGLGLREALTLLRKKLSPGREAVDAGDVAIRQRIDTLTCAYTRAIGAYVPQAIPVRTVVLSSGRDESDRRSVWYDCSGWTRLDQRPTIMKLPGNHLSCIGEHLSNLAECLKLIFATVHSAADIVSAGKFSPAFATTCTASEECSESTGLDRGILAEGACTRLTGAIAEEDIRCSHQRDHPSSGARAERSPDEGRNGAEGP